MRISGFSSLLPAIAVFSAHLQEGIKTLRSLRKERKLRSLRKERKTQKSSLISKEKVKKGIWALPSFGALSEQLMSDAPSMRTIVLSSAPAPPHSGDMPP